MLASFYLLMQPFVTVSNTCMRNKAASNFLAKIPLSHLPGLYLMPSKSMWQSKSAIRKKVFFCPHVKQMQCLAETMSFQATAHDGYLVAQCEGVSRCGMIGRVVGTSLAIKWYNVILMSGFFLDLHLNDLLKSSKRQNMSTISAFSPRHGKPHNFLFLLMWNEWLPAPSLDDCNFRDSASISQGLTVHFQTNTPTYCFIFGANIYKAILWVSLSIFFS